MSAAALPTREAGEVRPLAWVALGDSFTAGLSADERTWPELIERSAGERLRLHNLARAGATVAEVRAEQLPAAIAAGPDLVTVICGGNDVIRSVRPSLEPLAAELGELLGAPARGAAAGRDPDRDLPADRRRVRAAAADPGADRARHGRPQRDRPRERRRAHGIECVELAEHPGRIHGGNYADDGIHPSASGHEEAARTLGPALADAIRRHDTPTTEEQR